MRSRSCLSILASAALLLAACESDDVIRNVELALTLDLPHGESALVGDTLTVEFGAVEMVGAETRFVVWATTDTGDVALADSASPGEVEVDLADAGLVAADVDAVLVSEESAGADLPDGPPATVFLEGLPGGELMFGGLESHDFEGAMATAELHNEEIHIMAMGLPGLPDGYSYGVWLMFAGGGHGHSGDDDGHGDMEMMHMGDLNGAGMLETEGHRILGGAGSVAVTVEAANGDDMMSTSSVLSGEVVYETEGGPAEDEGGGGHMH
jgi:hypothetical protein